MTQITGMSILVPQSAGTVAVPPPGSRPYEVETDDQARGSGVGHKERHWINLNSASLLALFLLFHMHLRSAFDMILK